MTPQTIFEHPVLQGHLCDDPFQLPIFVAQLFDLVASSLANGILSDHLKSGHT